MGFCLSLFILSLVGLFLHLRGHIAVARTNLLRFPQATKARPVLGEIDKKHNSRGGSQHLHFSFKNVRF